MARSGRPIVDVWMQQPTQAFASSPMFKPLLRWMGSGFFVGTTDDTLKMMDRGDVTMGLVSAWYGPEGPLITNEEVQMQVNEGQGRLKGLASCDIRNPVEAVKSIRQAVANGCVGVRILPWLWNVPPDDRRFYPIYTTCVELGVPLCLQVGHTGPLRSSEPGRPIPYLENVCLDFPDLKIVGGHVGEPWLKEMIFLCTKFDNVYIDTSAYVPKRFPKELVAFMKGRGSKKVLFATNFPMILPETAIAQVDNLVLGEEGLDNYLFRNAERVFGISASPQPKL